MTDLFAATPVTLAEQIQEVKRELAMRAVVYPRQVARGGLKAEAAATHKRRMEAALETLEYLASLRFTAAVKRKDA